MASLVMRSFAPRVTVSAPSNVIVASVDGRIGQDKLFVSVRSKAASATIAFVIVTGSVPQ